MSLNVPGQVLNQTRLPQIGLTGSIGSGKSTVANFFKQWGSYVVDADLIARELLLPESPLTSKVIELFGPQVAHDGVIDRPALRSFVFSDSHARSKLEALLHPEIRKRMIADGELGKSGKFRSITFVIPLLFESNADYSFLTHTVLVSAERDVCVARASIRDASSPHMIGQIFDSQLPPSIKESRADFLIDNNKTQADLERNARDVFDFIHRET